MIPADKWPEWADRLCWDENGGEVGQFIGASIRFGVWYTDYEYTDIPIPPGHDWRVPVMRPTVKESLTVDLEQFRDLIGFACLQAINLPETDPRRDYIRQCSDLLALIDGQKGVG